MDLTEKQVESTVVYRGRIVTVRDDRAALSNGKIVPREVVEHPGGVAVVAVDADGQVALVRQFRYPMQEELWEIPAGKLEYGEDPLACALRELSEETGYAAGRIVSLGVSYPSPGYCGEKLHIFLATELTAGPAHPDEDEYLAVEKRPLDTVCDQIMKNEIADGKTIIGILKARRYFELAEK